MADDRHPATEAPSGGTGGTMDISDHVKTWLAFWAGIKWSVVGLIVIAALLFIFRTHNG